MRKLTTRLFLALTIAIAIALAMTLALATPAAAVNPDPAAAVTFTIPRLADLLGLIISVGLPLLVGIITRRTFKHKALVLLALAAVNGFLVELVNALTSSMAYDVGQGLLNAALSFGIAVLFHYGFLKPEGITARAQSLGPQ